MSQASLFDLPPQIDRFVGSHGPSAMMQAVVPQPPQEAHLPAGGWGTLNAGMAKLPPVMPAAGCLACARPVDPGAPFVAVLTGQVETVVKDGKTTRNRLPALLHGGCHPAWWAARCAAALAMVGPVAGTPDGASP